MTTTPKEIDVIVPIYNRERFVRPFIAMMAKQTYPAFKIYFACGQSQDHTDDEIQNAIKENPSMVIQSVSVGAASIGELRNYWLNTTSLQGDYLAFLDIDDLIDPMLLESLVNKAETDNADLVQCAFKRIDEKTGKLISLDMAHNPTVAISHPLDHTNIVFIHTGVPAKLFRRSLIGDDVRFGNSHRFEDVAFVAKYLAKANIVSFINQPLYTYVITKSSVSSFDSKEAVEKELQDARKVLLDLKQFYKKTAPEAEQAGFIDSLAFLRYGIGLTTRACLMKGIKRHQVIKESDIFLATYFPKWKTSSYLWRKNTKKYGGKTRFVQWCKHLYRIHCFGLFVFAYSAYTKTLKKDIKP